MQGILYLYGLQLLGWSWAEPIKSKPFQMMTVLLIDDNEDEFLLLSDALFRLDRSLNCIYANSCESALKILSKFDPHYIFVDLAITGIAGQECIAKARMRKERHRIPVVVYSAGISVQQWENAQMAGADAYLRKTGRADGLVADLVSLFVGFNNSKFDPPVPTSCLK